MNKKNEKIIKELVWLEAVIMTYIVTFVLVMLGSAYAGVMFFMVAFLVFGFCFSEMCIRDSLDME